VREEESNWGEGRGRPERGDQRGRCSLFTAQFGLHGVRDEVYKRVKGGGYVGEEEGEKPCLAGRGRLGLSIRFELKQQ